MATETLKQTMTAKSDRAVEEAHALRMDGAVESRIPIAVAARKDLLLDAEGKRFIDFNSR